jgi:hypothetical protein
MYITCWHETSFPSELVDILEKDLKKYDDAFKRSTILDDDKPYDLKIRNSRNSWVPSSHWIGGWLWYYISRTNRENFNYDITEIDDCSIQYTHYGPGEHYGWHRDMDMDSVKQLTYKFSSKDPIIAQPNLELSGQYVRKLSFSLLLSDPSEYENGEFQMLDLNDRLFNVPQHKGTLMIFDSRIKHRVRPVTSGLRKSLVGWVVGPRWK